MRIVLALLILLASFSVSASEFDDMKALAEQGKASAQNNLGVMYYSGQGTPQDYKKAHMWFNLAAVSGDEDSVKNRDIVAKNMTPADIAAAQQMAREWMEAHPWPLNPIN